MDHGNINDETKKISDITMTWENENPILGYFLLAKSVTIGHDYLSDYKDDHNLVPYIQMKHYTLVWTSVCILL